MAPRNVLLLTSKSPRWLLCICSSNDDSRFHNGRQSTVISCLPIKIWNYILILQLYNKYQFFPSKMCYFLCVAFFPVTIFPITDWDSLNLLRKQPRLLNMINHGSRSGDVTRLAARTPSRDRVDKMCCNVRDPNVSLQIGDNPL